MNSLTTPRGIITEIHCGVIVVVQLMVILCPGTDTLRSTSRQPMSEARTGKVLQRHLRGSHYNPHNFKHLQYAKGAIIDCLAKHDLRGDILNAARPCSETRLP